MTEPPDKSKWQQVSIQCHRRIIIITQIWMSDFCIAPEYVVKQTSFSSGHFDYGKKVSLQPYPVLKRL